MEEGRFRPSGNTFVADYFLKDHLGNVRMMIAEDGSELEETSYYPFGLIQRGISMQASANLTNKDKTFQGQKFDDDLGLNYYSFKWRNHDPQIGRFIEVDPLAGDYPHNSAYAFSENRVINGVELEGLEYMSYGYNQAGVRANIQATAQRSTQREKSAAGNTFRSGIKMAGGLVITTKNPAGVFGAGLLLTGTAMVVLMQEALEGDHSGLSGKDANSLKTNSEIELKENLGNENKELEKSNKTYEKRIQEHEGKLEDYKNDPDKSDNKKILEGKSIEQREKIINGRVKKLEKEIQKFKDNIYKNNQKIESNNKVIENN